VSESDSGTRAGTLLRIGADGKLLLALGAAPVIDIEDVERLRAEMFEQLAPATEGPVVNRGRERSGRLVFGDATD